MLLIFLTAMVIGFSGAMMPGSLLTYTIRQSLSVGPSAGFLITAGHAFLEIILIFLIFLGFIEHYTGFGIRMIMADPSECIDSESILPAVHKYFEVVEEKSYGNNLLQNALKNISHHFADENVSEEKQRILDSVFVLEDEFLKKYPSDFVFGIYRLKG